MKTISLLRLQARSWYRLTLILCALTFAFGNAWADPDYTKNNNNTPYNFTTSGCSGWTPYNTKSGGYCSATGSKGGDWYVLNSNISEFKAVNFNNYENVSLTIYVKAAINGGTNTYTVKLLDKDGNEISGTGYSATKENGMGSGSNASSDAKESSVSLSPTKAFAGYKIEFKTKSYITQTRYVLTYDDKAAVSCSNKVTVTKSVSGNGSFF